MYIFKAVTLSIALFFTNFLFATEKDSLVKKETGVLFAGGSQTNLKGIYFTGEFYYSKNKIRYALQYNYTGSHYINLTNFSGFLEHTNSVSTLIGYKIPIHKFSILLNGGLNFGTGRFATKSSYDYGWIIADNTSYFKTGFLGIIINGSTKYNLTDKINLGLSFTTFFNYYFQYRTSYPYGSNHQYKFQYLDNFYGLQLCADYKIRQWTKKK